jgi:type IV pilus assembly protein PilC
MKYLDKHHQVIDDTEQKKAAEAQATAALEKPVESLIKKEVAKQPSVVKKKHNFNISIGSVSLTAKMLFMDNLSTMLKAGLSLAPALRTLKSEIKSKYLHTVLDYLHDRVENGETLSKGMAQYPKVFPEMIIATVEVGENTGMLSDSLGHLASILKAQKKLRSKIIGAMIYPMIVLMALIGVSIMLSLFVFPNLVILFTEAGVELPFVLRAVNAINYVLRTYTWYIIGGFIAFIILFRYVFKLPKPKLLWHTLIIRIPFLGKFITELNLTRFGGNLFALLSAGLPIVKSMQITAKTLKNTRYRKEIIIMAEELEKGVSLGKSMEKRPAFFPTFIVQLANVGETTGELESVLQKVSEYYEERVDNVLTNMSSIIEPFLLIIVAVAVGFLAVSVITPMYELTLSFAE